jgi:DNA-binding response OmpR family regulator
MVLRRALPPSPPHLDQRILFVAEDCELRQLHAEVLTDAGYEVEVAEEVVSAWAALKLHSFDLMIADHDLTGIDAIGLARRLRSVGYTVPVIVAIQTLPTWESPQYPWLLKAIKLFKPYSVDQLLWAVKKALSQASRVRPLLAPEQTYNFNHMLIHLMQVEIKPSTKRVLCWKRYPRAFGIQRAEFCGG